MDIFCAVEATSISDLCSIRVAKLNPKPMLYSSCWLSGIPTYLLYVPRDIATFDGDAAEKVITKSLDGWVVSGHSGEKAAKMA